MDKLIQDLKINIEEGYKKFISLGKTKDEILEGLDIAIKTIQNSSIDDTAKTITIGLLNTHKADILSGKESLWMDN